MSSTVTRGLLWSGFLEARICSHASTAHIPSFSRMWLDPVPKLSSPQRKGWYCSQSMRLPKNFHPVGVSKQGIFLDSQTRSRALLVGMLLAAALRPDFWKKGMHSMLSAMIARESEGLTKTLDPKIMLRSASPSAAAPKAGMSPLCPSIGIPSLPTPMRSQSSLALAKLGSACPWEGELGPPKSSLGSQLRRMDEGRPKVSQKTFLA
mmetsp:Transcript_48502/g.152094  ORF Transcript_48502/g.152094 Transcript_48502/m.152094 type:complete len:207 (+) Transcript_48502:637-1257(+)